MRKSSNEELKNIIKDIENITSTTFTNILGKIVSFRGDIIQLDQMFNPIRSYNSANNGRDEWTLRDNVRGKDTKFTKRSLSSIHKTLSNIMSNNEFTEYKLIHVKRILDTLIFIGNGHSGYFSSKLFVTREYYDEEQKFVYVFNLGSQDNRKVIEFHYKNDLEYFNG